MPTVVGLFVKRLDADKVIGEVTGKGFARSQIRVVWRERSIPEIEEIEVVRYVDHFDGPAEEAKKGALGGAVGGLTVGAGSVLLASSGIMISAAVGDFLTAGTLVAATAAAAGGAVGGGVTGGALGALLGATDHDATKVKETETRHHVVMERDGFAMAIDVDDDKIDDAVAAAQSAGAEHISVIGSGPAIRVSVD